MIDERAFQKAMGIAVVSRETIILATLAGRRMADLDALLVQQVFDIPQRQRVANI